MIGNLEITIYISYIKYQKYYTLIIEGFNSLNKLVMQPKFNRSAKILVRISRIDQFFLKSSEVLLIN